MAATTTTRNKATLAALRRDVRAARNPAKAKLLAGFFKTGKGEYGEGDVFYGLTVPVTRAIAKRYAHLPLRDAAALLRSKVHEERLLALLLLVARHAKADAAERKSILAFYLRNAERVNNWDLVDLSAPHVVGTHLVAGPTKTRDALLRTHMRSKNLWRKRIAVVATSACIRAGTFAPTLMVTDLLMRDPHDLLHKACGWMLREVGKQDEAALVAYLAPRYRTMPRTMLRYAIEKFPEARRKRYLAGTA